jgi:hypothetical protein
MHLIAPPRRVKKLAATFVLHQCLTHIRKKMFV